MDKFSDRRAFPRRDLVVAVRPVGEASSDGWLSTRDVSAGGMRLLSERALGKGDRLALEILLPGGDWLEVSCKVTWSVKLDVGSAAEYEVGLRFLELSTDQLRRMEPLLPPAPPNVLPDGGVRQN